MLDDGVDDDDDDDVDDDGRTLAWRASVDASREARAAPAASRRRGPPRKGIPTGRPVWPALGPRVANSLGVRSRLSAPT